MTPRLFPQDATTFTTNGLGALSEAISCTVTEELNGIYELELAYPITGRLFSSLVNSALIVAEPYEGATAQAFRIYKVTKPLNGRITVNAQHISYQLNWIPVMPFAYSSLADCFAKLIANSASENPFTLWTNKTVPNGHSFDIPQSFRACLGGVQGSVLQMYGGDYEFDNWTVKLWLRRGADNGVRIAYGKNLIDAKQENNIEETYTGVCPYWLNEETGERVTLPEKYILATTAANFPYPRIKTVDFSSEFENKPTYTQLRNRTNQYIEANNIGHPNVSIDVNFLALWQTEEYKNIAPLERVQLGDTVTVDIERLGISTTARVIEYTYDVLKGRYKNITIGDAKSSFAKTFVDQGRAIEASLGESKAYTGKAVAAAKVYSKDYTDGEVADAIAQAEATASELMENATNWLTSSGGYVVAVKNSDGSWKELLFLDSPSTTQAVHVLRINENGIGFSSNGVNGPYKQAWTLDGKLVVGGTNAATISAVNGSNQEIFGVDSSGIRWILQSSIMTNNGTLYFLGSGATATSGNVLRLNSGGISFSRNGYNGSFGQAWNINGTLMIGGTNAVEISAYDGSNKRIFNVSKNGINWTMPQSILNNKGVLYFLGPGANATSGNVLRLNNSGISFSKNGYNGTYTQSWNINGELTLGGANNRYGRLMIQNADESLAAVFDNDQLVLYGYYHGDQYTEMFINGEHIEINTEDDGEDYYATLDGITGLLVSGGENDITVEANVSLGGIVVSDSGTGRASIHIDEDGNGRVESQYFEGGVYCVYDDGEVKEGVTGTVTAAGGASITFVNGIAVAATSGLDGWEDAEVMFADGGHWTFEKGILTDYYET